MLLMLHLHLLLESVVLSCDCISKLVKFRSVGDEFLDVHSEDWTSPRSLLMPQSNPLCLTQEVSKNTFCDVDLTSCLHK